MSPSVSLTHRDTHLCEVNQLCFLLGILSDNGDRLLSGSIFILTHITSRTLTQTHTHTQWHGVMVNSLGLYVSLLSYSVGNLLTVVVFLLGFGQLFDWFLQLCLNAAQLIYGLWKGKRANLFEKEQTNMSRVRSFVCTQRMLSSGMENKDCFRKLWLTHTFAYFFELLLLVESNSLSGLWHLALVVVAHIEPGLAHLHGTF